MDRVPVKLDVRDLEYLVRITSEQRPMSEDDMLARNRAVHVLTTAADAAGVTL